MGNSHDSTMERAYPTTQTLPPFSCAVFTVRWSGTPTSVTALGISESVPSSINICTNIRTVKLQWVLPKRTDVDQTGENNWLAVQLIIKVNVVVWLLVYCKSSHLHSRSCYNQEELFSRNAMCISSYIGSKTLWKYFKFQIPFDS